MYVLFLRNKISLNRSEETVDKIKAVQEYARTDEKGEIPESADK